MLTIIKSLIHKHRKDPIVFSHWDPTPGQVPFTLHSSISNKKTRRLINNIFITQYLVVNNRTCALPLITVRSYLDIIIYLCLILVTCRYFTVLKFIPFFFILFYFIYGSLNYFLLKSLPLVKLALKQMKAKWTAWEKLQCKYFLYSQQSRCNKTKLVLSSFLYQSLESLMTNALQYWNSLLSWADSFMLLSLPVHTVSFPVKPALQVHVAVPFVLTSVSLQTEFSGQSFIPASHSSKLRKYFPFHCLCCRWRTELKTSVIVECD